MAVLLIFIIIALVFNTVLLKPTYNRIKKKELLKTVDIVNNLDGDYQNNLDALNFMEEKLTLKILIYNENNVLYLSMLRLVDGKYIANKDKPTEGIMPMKPFNMNDIRRFMDAGLSGKLRKRNIQFEDEDTTISKLTTKDLSSYLLLDTKLDDGSTMMIIAELQSMDESIRIFNFFLLVSAFICMVISGVLALIMSRRFVRPIKNMNDVTSKIANLDFSSECEVNTEDEIKELADSINTLSTSLESTIYELKQELENAKRLENLRKRFISTVSHELKTPIALLQGYSIGISSDVCEDKEKRDYYASVIADESEHLGELVNELMDLTQLESGFITLHEDDFELTEYMQEIVEKYKAANPEINFDYNKPNDEMWVKGDIRLLERVLSNYLSNAIRHVNDNKYIRISLSRNEGYIKVRVFNSGNHIQKDKIDEIWNSFYRVDDARTRKSGGHGLGLAIVKNIQSAHGMGYSVDNVDGGVEFSFDIKNDNLP